MTKLNRNMTKINFTPADEYIDEVWGKTGTPERDNMEDQVKEELNSYLLGETIKQERIKQKLTQEELGERVGVKKSQISKLENGRSIISLPTMSKVFKALGFHNATLDLGKGQRVALW